jgi:acetolactate synthase-1/2/3 large subunit
MYGTIRMHQERHYPERTHGTELRNPDFVLLAQSYGAYAERVRSTAEFAPPSSAPWTREDRLSCTC